MIQEDRLLRHIERLGEHPRTPGPRLMRWESRDDALPVVVEVKRLVGPWQAQADEYGPERRGRAMEDALDLAWDANRVRRAREQMARRTLAAD